MATPKKREARSIIIIEGPAGAGKSFLADALKKSQIPVVQRSLSQGLSRSFERDNAAIDSLINDEMKVVEALFTLRTSPLVFIDRCFLSQQVYHHLRLNHPQERQMRPLLPRFWRGIELHVNRTLRDLRGRGLTFPYSKVLVFWLFYPITVEALEERRKTSSKTYPWRADLEVRTYEQAIGGRLTHQVYDIPETTPLYVDSPHYALTSNVHRIVAAVTVRDAETSVTGVQREGS